MERQKGGIGVRGGPGEKQIELDKRMLGLRIKQLKEKLRKLAQQRGMQRRARKRSQALSIAIVGYTNAGKSTLFNYLTHESILSEDKLFATLDTTSRKLFIEPGHSVVISDTVGFIKNLPTTLIEAFKSTLEEVTDSDLLIHVVDISNENKAEQIKEVGKILEEINAHELPQILVLNQIDKINLKTSCDRDDYGKINHIQLSAKTGNGIEFLKQAMVEQNQTLITKEMETMRNILKKLSPRNILGANNDGPPDLDELFVDLRKKIDNVFNIKSNTSNNGSNGSSANGNSQ